MPVQSVNAISGMKFAPEIVRALESIELPEVKELMRALSKYHLAVCIPHMHRPDVDFDALPDDTVQVEENCQVRWVHRSELERMQGHVPVAWRWAERGAVADAECIQTCTPSNDPKKGHKRGHL